MHMLLNSYYFLINNLYIIHEYILMYVYTLCFCKCVHVQGRGS